MADQPIVRATFDTDRKRTYSFVFTKNNYKQTDIDALLANCGSGKDFCAISFNAEIGDEKKVPHLQGFAQSAKVSRYSTLGKRYKMWAASMEGSIEQNAVYTTKQGQQHWEKGTFVNKEQGKRKDLDQIVAHINAGRPMQVIARAFPGQYIRYNRGIEKLHSILQAKPEIEKKHNIIRWGDSGTGKSHDVWSSGKTVYSVPVTQNTTWFPNYADEEILFFDEFVGGIPLVMLLRILDKYPVQIPTGSGGANVWLRSKQVVFASNVPPALWYPHARESQVEALNRRIDQLFKYTWIAGLPKTVLRQDEKNQVDIAIVTLPSEPIGIEKYFSAN